MIIAHYTNRLPQGYDRERIRALTKERAPIWDARPELYFKAFLAYYAVVVIVAGAGIASAYRQPALRPDAILILLYFASLSIVHALMFVEMRHRWAAELLLLVFVPFGAAAVIDARPRRSREPSAVRGRD